VIVRPAVSAEVAQLSEVAALTFPLACPPGSTADDQQAFIADVLSPERFASYLADPERAVLVAVDGTLVGYTMLVFSPPTDPDVRAALTLGPSVELSKCYVHPGHHGAGVAHALMSASIEVARERAAAAMWLGVNQQNARARAFYERSGFAVVGTKHFTVGSRIEDDFVLERPL